MVAAKNAKSAKMIAVLRWRCFNAEAQGRRVRRENREFGRKEHIGHKVVSGYNWVL